MEVKVYGNKNQANLRIDSDLQNFLKERIENDYQKNQSLISNLTISSIGISRLLSKLNLRYSEGVGIRKYDQIEFILIRFNSEKNEYLAFYLTKYEFPNFKIKIDFLRNTAENIKENTIQLDFPIMIICNHNGIFFNHKSKIKLKIFERFEREEYNRQFELVKFYFDFLILPRRYFTNFGILELTLQIKKIFEINQIYSFEENNFIDYLKAKKYRFLISPKGIFVRPRNDLEIILLNYLDYIQKDQNIIKYLAKSS